MKKALLIIACVVMAIGAYAQEGTFKLGVKAGVNFSGYWGDDANGTTGKFGYQGGLVGEYRASSMFAIAPELIFTSQGAKMGWDEAKDGKKCNYVNYIALPIMAKIYTGENFSVNIGPEFGVAVFNHWGGEKMPRYNDFNFGIAVGATYYVDKNVFVDARYTMGVTDVYKDLDAKNYNVSLGVGYFF